MELYSNGKQIFKDINTLVDRLDGEKVNDIAKKPRRLIYEYVGGPSRESKHKRKYT